MQTSTREEATDCSRSHILKYPRRKAGVINTWWDFKCTFQIDGFRQFRANTFKKLKQQCPPHPSPWFFPSLHASKFSLRPPCSTCLHCVFIKHSVLDTFLFINTAIVLSGTVAVCASGVRFLLFSSSPNIGHLAPWQWAIGKVGQKRPSFICLKWQQKLHELVQQGCLHAHRILLANFQKA